MLWLSGDESYMRKDVRKSSSYKTSGTAATVCPLETSSAAWGGWISRMKQLELGTAFALYVFWGYCLQASYRVIPVG